MTFSGIAFDVRMANLSYEEFAGGQDSVPRAFFLDVLSGCESCCEAELRLKALRRL